MNCRFADFSEMEETNKNNHRNINELEGADMTIDTIENPARK